MSINGPDLSVEAQSLVGISTRHHEECDQYSIMFCMALMEFDHSIAVCYTMAVEQTANAVIGRLTAEKSNRLGRILKQLQVIGNPSCLSQRELTSCIQVLGLEGNTLQRLQAQISSAIGDDDEKQFRILKLAIKKLIGERAGPVLQAGRSLHAPADFQQNDEEGNIEVQQQIARQVVQYPITQEGESNTFRKSFQGEQEKVMWEGMFIQTSQVFGELFAGKQGRPMLSAVVAIENLDCEGISNEQAIEEAAALLKPDISNANSGQSQHAPEIQHASSSESLQNEHQSDEETEEETPLPTKLATITRTLSGSRNRDHTRPLRLEINHNYENKKGSEMKAAIFGSGRYNEEQIGQCALPGCNFWRAFVLAAVGVPDTSFGGNRLDPPIKLNIPETIAYGDWGRFFGFYTGSDGYLYRLRVPKDSTVQWLSQMRLLRIRKSEERKVYPQDENEPNFVERSNITDTQNDVRLIMNECFLKDAIFSATSSRVFLWQGFIRSAGRNARIYRTCIDSEKKFEPHYIICSTAHIGMKSANFQGYICNASELQGSKNVGRSNLIERVQSHSWAESSCTAASLAHFSLQTYLFGGRKNKNVQKFPKFSPQKIVVDFIVDRDGVWWFSQMLILKATKVTPSTPRKPAFMEENENSSMLQTRLQIVHKVCTAELQAQNRSPMPSGDPVLRVWDASPIPDLDSICKLGANPRLQKCSERLFKEAVLTRLRRVPGRVRSACGHSSVVRNVESRVQTIYLSGAESADPMHRQLFLRRVGGIDESSGPNGSKASIKDSVGGNLERSASCKSVSRSQVRLDVTQSGLSAVDGLDELGWQGEQPLRPASAMPRLTGNRRDHQRSIASIRAAAKALGHPV